MKIAMVCFTGAAHAPGCSPPAGRVPELATALVEQGNDVVVYLRRGAWGEGSAPSMGGARMVPLAAGPPVELTEAQALPHAGAFAERLRDELAELRPDVLHSHGWLAGMATLLAGGEDHPPVAHTFHHRPWLPRPKSKVGRAAMNRCRAERAVAHRADQLIACSLDEELSLRRMGVPRARITLVPPGVDCGELSPDGTSEQRDRRFRLVLLGGTDRVDGGVGTAVRALTALPDTELVILPDPAGSVPDEEDGTDRAGRLAHRLRVADRVRVQRGHDQGQRRALVRSADAVVCMSAPRDEGDVVLEVMACAEPVIASRDADPLEAVVDGVTGLHVDPADPKLFAVTVRELLDNAALRQGMGLAGRDRAVHRFGWPHIAAETGRLYRRLADRTAMTSAMPATATS